MLWAQIVTAQPRATFAYGDDPAQAFDAYLTDGARDALAIVMLHGGAWCLGDKRNRAVWQEKVVHWQPQGFLTVMGFASQIVL